MMILCIIDRLKKTLPGASQKELSALLKLAETALFTSQGVPFIYAGDEIMRDKKECIIHIKVRMR